MTKRKWNIQKIDLQAVAALAAELNLPLPIAQVLVQRGCREAQALDEFLNPRLDGLSDPFALPGVELAVGRIWQAIEQDETIVVFGDYDVDGVTAAALMIRVLSVLGARVEGFVPDRLDEGYGLSSDALNRCLEELRPGVIVSVDCGTNSVESIARTQQLGVDVIVTDHHEPEEQTAPAIALVNPKLGQTGHTLSGVGVAFKLAHALVKTGREQNNEHALQIDLRHYLDLVALGTVADIVPLLGENRIFVRHGLVQLESTQWIGMEVLKEAASISGELNTGHLGFQLGPRINAAGRIGEPLQALRLLTTNDLLEARNIAKMLDRNNHERRAIERKMADDAFAEIDSYYDPARHFGLVVAREGWHPGVVGIVASRVSRHYNRPAIIMGIDEDGSARGSCRGIEEFDMLAGLQACEGHLAKFGGHRMAAGLEVKSGELEAFRVAFAEVSALMLKEVDLSPVQQIDAEVAATGLNWDFFEALKQLRPFGQANAEPVWALLGAQVVGKPRVVGKKHLKLLLCAEDLTFDAIAFNYPLETLPSGRIDVAFKLQENSWNGSSSLQLQVAAIRSSE